MEGELIAGVSSVSLETSHCRALQRSLRIPHPDCCPSLRHPRGGLNLTPRRSPLLGQPKPPAKMASFRN